MSSSPHDFDSLDRLLRLKRYERPPPRYFNDFSDRVISRLEAGEGRNSWWERFGFDLRPAFAAAAGMLACGLVVYGVATADGDVEFRHNTAALGSPEAMITPAEAVLVQAARPVTVNSTNPLQSYGTSIDRKAFGGASVTPAGFQMH